MAQKNQVAPTEPVGPYERVPVEKLSLDAENPRLAEFGISIRSSQFDLLKTLWDEMAVQEIAMSIAFSGYFEHEPLFVEKDNQGHLVVIEGNRRLAAVKLLLDADLRRRVKATDLPTISAARAKEISTLPVVTTTRQEAWRYLGFKHVNGPSTWGSYAKAQYIAHVHNEYGIPLDQIAEQIGDYHSTILRMYRGLMIIEQAEKAKVFNRHNTSKNRFHFNYIYSGMDSPGIRAYLGLEQGSKNFSKPVPAAKVRDLGELLTWLYGDKKKHKQSLIKSQNPDLKKLDIALQSAEGVKALKDGLSLDIAQDISLGDERLFRYSLQQAKLNLQKALGTLTTGFVPSDNEALVLASDVEELARDLVDSMTQKKSRETRVQRRGNA
jgi:hypothetical protein